MLFHMFVISFSEPASEIEFYKFQILNEIGEKVNQKPLTYLPWSVFV